MPEFKKVIRNRIEPAVIKLTAHLKFATVANFKWTAISMAAGSIPFGITSSFSVGLRSIAKLCSIVFLFF